MKNEEKKAIIEQLAQEHGPLTRPVDDAAVFNACDMLWDKGLEPTIDGIRTILGKGNRATIQKSFDGWKRERDERKAQINATPGKPGRIIEMFDLMWAEAVKYGRMDADALKAQLEAQIENHQNETKGITGALEDSEADVERLEGDLATLKAELERARAKYAQDMAAFTETVAAAEKRAASAEMRAEIAEKTSEELRRLNEMLTARINPPAPAVAEDTAPKGTTTA